MKNIVKFCKDCDAFFVVTKNGQFPSARPFGAIMEKDGKLYMATNNTKNVYKQIIKDNHIHIVAIKRSTRNWMRFNAVAKEVDDIKLKEIFFTKCPRLVEIYKKPTARHFTMFILKVSKLEIYKD